MAYRIGRHKLVEQHSEHLIGERRRHVRRLYQSIDRLCIFPNDSSSGGFQCDGNVDLAITEYGSITILLGNGTATSLRARRARQLDTALYRSSLPT